MEKILTASPEALIFGALFILVTIIARLVKKGQWFGHERRDSLFSDRQRIYIDERITHKFNNVMVVVVDIRTSVKRIENRLDELAESYNKLERRLDIHEAVSDKDRS